MHLIIYLIPVRNALSFFSRCCRCMLVLGVFFLFWIDVHQCMDGGRKQKKCMGWSVGKSALICWVLLVKIPFFSTWLCAHQWTIGSRLANVHACIEYASSCCFDRCVRPPFFALCCDIGLVLMLIYIGIPRGETLECCYFFETSVYHTRRDMKWHIIYSFKHKVIMRNNGTTLEVRIARF
jgi:hypothetical protein